jgi:single-strand DNA-binding protein
MNSTLFSGRLTKDPVYTAPKKEGGISAARFTLAVENKWQKDGENKEPNWIPCVVFGKSADALVKYVKKGNKIIVKGRISTDKYEAKPGEWVYTWSNIVEEWEFAESKRDNNEQSQPQQQYEPVQQPQSVVQQPQQQPMPQPVAQQQPDEEVPDGFLNDLENDFFG